MKLVSIVTTLLALAIPVFSQTESLSYDNIYDDATYSLNNVACSNGQYGLESLGYTTLGSIPTFPNLGGVYAVTGWGSPACGTCWEVTWGNNTLAVLAVDTANEGFNLSEEAMNTLTGGLAVELGRVNVTATQVSASVCKIPS